jgi:hypothetical protein
MQLQVILNALDRRGSFIDEKVRWRDDLKRQLDIVVRPRRGSRPICSVCGKHGGTHDHLAERRVQHVPL